MMDEVDIFDEGGKGYFRDSWSAPFSPWNVKRLLFSSWIVIFKVAVKRDFVKLFSVKQKINV